MCFEWKNQYSCNHIGFRKVERCALLGMGCFGPNGSEKFVVIDHVCYDCKTRQHDPNPAGRENDPYRKREKAGSG